MSITERTIRCSFPCRRTNLRRLYRLERAATEKSQRRNTQLTRLHDFHVFWLLHHVSEASAPFARFINSLPTCLPPWRINSSILELMSIYWRMELIFWCYGDVEREIIGFELKFHRRWVGFEHFDIAEVKTLTFPPDNSRYPYQQTSIK